MQCLENINRFYQIEHEKKQWVIKYKPNTTDEEKRDLLGYLLGSGFANTAEVKLLEKDTHHQIKEVLSLDHRSTSQNTFLVRSGESYTLQDLPCKTIDEAVAAELVYSVWARRRDAHVDNRVYTRGIPVFFDHQTAFLGEPHLASIKTFFSQTGGGWGDARMWRIKKVKRILTTEYARSFNREPFGAYHYLHSLENFQYYLGIKQKYIEEFPDDRMRESIGVCNFEKRAEEAIYDFLKKNRDNLDKELTLMNSFLCKT